MSSMWLDGAPRLADDPMPDGPVDDLVIGAGITGLTTALLLARSGRRVHVLEAGRIGGLTTGHSTAKISLLQGTKLSTMRGYQSAHVTQAYVDANIEGQQWLLRFCDDHEVAVQHQDAVTYAATSSQVSTVRKEHDAALAAGLPVHWADDLDVPFEHHGAVVLPEQAQLDPVELCHALADQVRSHGGTITQGVRATQLRNPSKPSVITADGAIVRAEQVIVATGTPIFDRSLYFSKLEPQRSYIVSFEVPAAQRGMYLAAGKPSRSVRPAPSRGAGEQLLVGGAGHTVGRPRGTSEAERLDQLREWTAKHYPGAVETHAWSAQDYTSHDTVPYVGPMPRGGGHVHVATGFDKWGMTNGVAAARAISGEILGALPSWQKPMRHRITRPRGVAHLASLNVRVGLAQVIALGAGMSREVPSSVPEGTGVVGRDGAVPTGVSTVDGRTCAVAAVCTHLGGTLEWNDAEQSWDCPLHGSRFQPDGEVIEGPATKPLKQRDLSS